MLIDTSEILGILATATLLVSLFYLPGIRTGINFADEGYLWYGTLKVLEGEVPIRDFRAYDPGRYYWCAIWMLLFGKNLLSVRIALSVAQILALSAGLAVIYIATRGAWLPTILTGLAMIGWTYPLHKQIDILFSMTTPLMAVLLVDSPFASQYVLSGMYVGVCFLFGLNHGIYAGGGLLALILVMGFGDQGLSLNDSLAGYITGLSLGVLPIFAMFIFVPRLFKVYWRQKISRVLRRGTANLSFPIPWLWKSELFQLRQLDKGGQFVVKCMFTFIPVLYVIAILPVISGDISVMTREWAMVAVACSGLFYWHHAVSRADLSHLAQSIAPFIMLLVIFFAEFTYGWAATCVLIAVSLRYVYLAHASWVKHFFKACDLEKVNIGETALWLEPWQANYLGRVRSLVEAHSKQGDFVLLLPNLVAFYSMLQRKPAVYDLFCVYPATEAEETQMIEELSTQEVGFALINNEPTDAREDLRFSHTHPGVWQYLNHEFQLLDEEGIPPHHYVFIKR